MEISIERSPQHWCTELFYHKSLSPIRSRINKLSPRGWCILYTFTALGTNKFE